MIKSFLRKVGLYHQLRDARRTWRFHRKSRGEIRAWRSRGSPMPLPDAMKYAVIRSLARAAHTPILVETGTFYGNAVFTLRRDFEEIHTIELAPGLFALNRREFAHLRHVHVHLGDSATILPLIVPALRSPALYWLDGHFCAGPSARADQDTPIGAELAYLLGRAPGDNVVLIDDARLFAGTDGYPTIEGLKARVARHRPNATFAVAQDIIRIRPV